MTQHTTLWPREEYADLDVGIRFAVKVLHARGIDTCQSCEGGDGHSYDRPTIDMSASSDGAEGFAALAALVAYGLPVQDVSLVWSVNRQGLPYDHLWRVTFWKPMPERADEDPLFVYSYVATR